MRAIPHIAFVWSIRGPRILSARGMVRIDSVWCLCCVVIMAALLLQSGCQDTDPSVQRAESATLRLATTTSTVGSGLLDELLPAFQQQTGLEVEVIARGSGAAMELARDGGADVLLAHAPEAENTFVIGGYGVNRREVMYNDFVILGPADDPAGLRGETDAVAALAKLAKQQVAFLSRGDNSGTHMREQGLWVLADCELDGPWYESSRAGMLETLQQASREGRYVLSDSSTYRFHQESLNLAILVEGDKRLFNPYGVMAVSPTHVSDVNFKAAMQFVDFITSAETQEMIRRYGEDRFGKPLFIPLAIRE